MLLSILYVATKIMNKVENIYFVVVVSFFLEVKTQQGNEKSSPLNARKATESVD